MTCQSIPEHVEIAQGVLAIVMLPKISYRLGTYPLTRRKPDEIWTIYHMVLRDEGIPLLTQLEVFQKGYYFAKDILSPIFDN